MRAERAAVALLVFSACTLAAAAEFGGLGAPLRPFLMFFFLLVCPGLAVTCFIRLEGLLAPALLIAAASVVVDGGVAEILVLTKNWSPELALAILIGVSAAGALLQLVVAPARAERMP
jgi:hypothetical protein